MNLIQPKTLAPPIRTIRIRSEQEVIDMPPLNYAVKSVFPIVGLAAIYGPSGSGKSFLTLDLVKAVASGSDWFQHRTRRLPVLYVCLEGEAGMAQRVKAHRAKYGDDGGQVHFVFGPWELTASADLSALISAAKESGLAGGLLVIDTLNRASPGADENSGEAMGRMIAAASEIQRTLGGLVLLVHHTGKDVSKGMRGHSSLFAALDASVEVSRDGETRSWRIAKSKDGMDGEETFFSLHVVEVGLDEDGDAITSCVVVPCDARPSRRRMPVGKNVRLVFKALGEFLVSDGDNGIGPAPGSRPAIELEKAVDLIAPRLVDAEPKRRRERTRAAIESLMSDGFVEHLEGKLWLK